ncbi:hypothetical protein [Kribbella sp. CA-293567]|uniref:hypothetical protein n=1 Tax=Kribbella sp. CA-293567 TaxID=3002436 RepID=UPI0022DE4252|nr:hypothetical protein [Kribbella sp. CA-293567]WBQ02988.1 hypothetical protein OX958_23760 [Kribbella sp. CA-293567]
MKLRSVHVTGRPIQTWPGELTRERKSSTFKAGWSSTIDLLDRELHHLDAENVVLQLAMRESDFRLDGAPKANARATHPGVILSLDSPYGALSYPCDRFTQWADNLRAIALALEALRKVDRYGVTKNGEQYTGWKQLDAARPAWSTDSAAIFIVNAALPDSTDDQLRHHAVNVVESLHIRARMYRKAAARLHPDVAGGNAAQFLRLTSAKKFLDGA